MKAEPPYGIICEKLKEGKVIPFLGAGASRVLCPKDKQSNSKYSSLLPSGSDLSKLLADKCSFPSKNTYDICDLAKVSSYYQLVSGKGRDDLHEELRKELLNKNYKTGKLHKLLAKFENPMVIVSTNYDTLMEEALDEAKKPYYLIIYPTEDPKNANSIRFRKSGSNSFDKIKANKLDINLEERTVIYKMHGNISKDKGSDHFVITEEDYVEFLSRMTTGDAIPAIIIKHFVDRHFLFLGYSLKDWNLRVILHNIKKHIVKADKGKKGDNGVSHWAIQSKPSEFELQIWWKRNVIIYDMDLDKFVEKMDKFV